MNIMLANNLTLRFFGLRKGFILEVLSKMLRMFENRKRCGNAASIGNSSAVFIKLLLWLMVQSPSETRG